MHQLSDKDGSFGYGDAPSQDGDFASSSTRDELKKIIGKADSIPLASIFKHLKIPLNHLQTKTTCPFKNHKNGQETTASFNYYPNTNSFYCFGCKMGGEYAHGTQFLATLEGITKSEAAKKILSLFEGEVDVDLIVYNLQNFSERLNTLTLFSNSVREFRLNNFNYPKALDFIENYICLSFDNLNIKYKLDNQALKRTVEELIIMMENYK